MRRACLWSAQQQCVCCCCHDQVHTTVVRRLGPLELVLMTPSHHRVHHDRRVHKNYGGLLIVWDRIFGSFVGTYVSAVGGQGLVLEFFV